MSVKQDVLKILINTQNDYISGENLAQTLNVSRNSIWKAIKSLQNDGYDINAVTNKGYCLLSSSDVLSKNGIEKYLSNGDFFDLEVFDEVTSTNTLLKEQGNLGEREGKVIVSACQTNGRGRLGRNFHSPSDTGVYFSLLLRPKIPAEQSIFLTTMTSIAVANAISSVTGEQSQIKWVNDIFVRDKKVCGILCEANFTMENFSLDYVTLGIGINVYEPKEGFPSEIQDIAGSILKNHVDDVRNKLVAHVLDNFLQLYRDFDTEKIAEQYKSLSYVLGKEIYVIKNGNHTKATAIDLDNACGLVVKYENGVVETLNSGEISTKIISL
ncbi:MAG: biotin--[acetyl-CoA-carboxylase] ligase [Clostridia bacterium]